MIERVQYLETCALNGIMLADLFLNFVNPSYTECAS
jgi:hypothetical protein